MATIGNSFLNLIDMYKMNGDGRDIGDVVEMLHAVNPILWDAIAVEANMGTTHRTRIRTGLPSVTWGRLYQGIPQSKSTYQQVDDTTGFVEGLSTVDKRALDLSPNPAATRLMEAKGYLEAMSQEVASGIFYHDVTTTPEKFKGLAARYNKLSGGIASRQVINGGSVDTDNTSIWFVTWGADTTSLVYPKGMQAGITRDDKGEQRALDASGNPYYVKEELFTQHVGVSVRDWRYNVRIANIDVSNMKAGSVDLYGLLRKAYYRFEGRRRQRDMGLRDANGAGVDNNIEPGSTAIYCNSDILEALDALATNKGASDSFIRLTPQEIEGKQVLTYRNIPIRETDALLNTESLVS